MADFYLPVMTLKGEPIRCGDTVRLRDCSLTVVKGVRDGYLEHTGGFCLPCVIVGLEHRPEYKEAKIFVNSSHVSKDKENNCCFNIHIPVLLTGKTKKILNELHHEVIFPGGESHWISYYSLIV